MLLCLLVVLPAAARQVSPQRECATCHVMWLTEFQREGVMPLIDYDPTPVVETGRQDIASTERMCFSCHDGFVLDSRFVWADREHFHPVGVIPSPDIHIPTSEGKEIFPLNYDGKVYCGTCHSAHGIEWGTERISPLFLRTENVESSLCFACHLERGTGTDEGNHPVFREIAQLPNLDAPPERLRELGAKFGDDGTVICQSCHRVHGARDDKLLMVDNSNSALCSNCHDDRYVGGLQEAQARHTHPVNTRPERVTVPDNLIALGSKLGDGGTVICQTCHKPHNAEAGPKILVKRNDDAQLCVQCHKDKAHVADSKHDMRLVPGAGLNVRGQTSHEGGVCSACHVPHRGNGPKMWARPVGNAVDPMAGICLSCHGDGGVAEDRQVGEYTHPVGKPLANLPEPVSLPGYNRFGHRTTDARTGSVTCASCHDPHRWNAADPEHKVQPGEKAGPDGFFLRQPNDRGSTLCLSCHKDKHGLRNSKHDLTVMAPNERNIRGQSPQQAGPCSACHVVHHGVGPVMLAREPGKGGEDVISSICLSCHNPQGAAHEALVGEHSHPVSRPIANVGIRAGIGGWYSEIREVPGLAPPQALPLFDNKGNRMAEGGDIACASCHDPHQWDPGRRTSSGDPRKLKGDSQTSFLRMANDAGTGLCVNCHRTQSAVTMSKHNLDISAPRTANVQGRTVAQAGPCSACHLPHQGMGPRMWARDDVDEDEGITGLCLSCHREAGVAESRQVGEGDDYGHPLHVAMPEHITHVDLPLFTRDGTLHRGDGQGLVECASCHNPHQWDPSDPLSTAGVDPEAEGDPSTSFLRMPALAEGSTLCVECHK